VRDGVVGQGSYKGDTGPGGARTVPDLLVSAQDGTLVRTWRGKSGIYDISWNSNGTKLAASFADSTVRGTEGCGRARNGSADAAVAGAQIAVMDVRM
jgi:hypothetical protein